VKNKYFPAPVRKTAVAALAVAMLAGACSSSSHNGSSSTTSPQGSSGSESGGGSGGLPAYHVTAADKTAVVSYVGGKAQAATGSPIEIGFVNSNTGPAAFPQFTEGVQAAVNYANAHLNGAQGHQIKLDVCSIGSEEDGQSCGTSMINNTNIHVIIEGVLVEGGDTFFKVINNQKVVLQLSANSTADLFPYSGVAKPYVYDLNAGAVGGYDAMLAYIGTDVTPKPTKILFIADTAPAAKAGIETFQGQLKQYNIPTSAVYLLPGAGAAQDAAQVQGGGGNTADVWFMLTDLNTCLNAMLYAKQAHLHPLLAGAECVGKPMQAVNGAYAPDGLISSDYGLTYWIPSENPIGEVIDQQVDQVSPNDPAPDSIALGFAQSLNLFRALNSASDVNSVQSIATALTSMPSPILDNIGSSSCGNAPLFVTICGNQVGLIQAKGSSWVRLSPTAQLPAFTVWQFKTS
jgi:hypothetical protein